MIRHNDATDFLSVADILGELPYADPRPIYRAIKQGRLRAIQLVENGPWLIRQAWWDEFVQARSQSHMTDEQLQDRRRESMERLGFEQPRPPDDPAPRSKRQRTLRNP